MQVSIMRKIQAGFTLLEAMVTLLVIGIAVNVAMPTMVKITANAKQQKTADRYQQIRESIISVRTVNGQPVVAGFAADVGRLPRCIKELLDGNCARGEAIPAGWTGPYLNSPDGAFHDGWGNCRPGHVSDYDGSCNEPNFGWLYVRVPIDGRVCPATLSTDLSVSSYPDCTDSDYGSAYLLSLGADNQPDALHCAEPVLSGLASSCQSVLSGSTVSDIDRDYPPVAVQSGSMMKLVAENDWLLNLDASSPNATRLFPVFTTPDVSSPGFSMVQYPVCASGSLQSANGVFQCSDRSSPSVVICPDGSAANPPPAGNASGASAYTLVSCGNVRVNMSFNCGSSAISRSTGQNGLVSIACSSVTGAGGAGLQGLTLAVAPLSCTSFCVCNQNVVQKRYAAGSDLVQTPQLLDCQGSGTLQCSLVQPTDILHNWAVIPAGSASYFCKGALPDCSSYQCPQAGHPVLTPPTGVMMFMPPSKSQHSQTLLAIP